MRGDGVRLWRAAVADLRGRVLYVDPLDVDAAPAWFRLAPRADLPEPPDGPFDVVVARVPRGRAGLGLLVEILSTRLADGGVLRLWGGNDEGIRAASRDLSAWFDDVGDGAAVGHGRVLLARSPRSGGRDRVAAAVELFEVEALGRRVVVHGLPGLFAHGRLDEGSRLLLDAVGLAGDGEEWLDVGCGPGTLGAVRGGRWTGVDADVWAVAAARHGFPLHRVILGDRCLPAAAHGSGYDRVVSNPPLHVGSADSSAVAAWLASDAGRVLSPRGELVVVTPRRVPFGAWCERYFRDVGVLREHAGYRVWRAHGTVRAGQTPQEGA